MRGNTTIVISGVGALVGEKVLSKIVKHECTIILLDQHEGKLKDLVNAYGAYKANLEYYCVDWSNRDELENIFYQIYDHYGFIDTLISLLDSFYFGSPLNKINFFETEEMININFLTNLYLISQTLPMMLEEDHGSIVVLGEGISTHKSMRNSIYRATKTALSTYWRELKKTCMGKKVQLALVHYNDPTIQNGASKTQEEHFGSKRENEEKFGLAYEQIANMIDAIVFRKHSLKVNVVYVG